MKNFKVNYLFLLIALLPIFLFKLPMWTIDLEAPQFPEGLQMRIFLNEVTGDDEHSLESINRLNHYIGMKNIEPDSIAELKYMPAINLFMIVAGIILSLFYKKHLLLIWLAVFSILGLLGLYDFYLWETDFAQNLAPNAIIKTAGVSYQPPLIGAKQIMNFRVVSLPGTGGIILFAGLTIGWGYILIDWILKRRAVK
ncbi:MAG: hypothetical protein RO257_09290 [Candidatus Kapabacteria bacterium]|jgi:copper chaperone NosL|nr:hypothetical protein [Candidatus Kapabacteria bacterium]